MLFTTTEQTNRVPYDAELKRIIRLPRRNWLELTQQLTEILKRPDGKMRLKPIQAVALYELGISGGLFGPMRVGAGKTLISFLAPIVVNSKRPLLLIPAALKEKTQRDKSLLTLHWRLPYYSTTLSYEWLGRIQAAQKLDTLQPDLIIADEAHRLKNPRTAVTRRVARFLEKNPQTKFVALSGTMTKRSIKDFSHLLAWAHSNPPIPTKRSVLELWADALDERKGQLRRAHPGALEALCNDEERLHWTLGHPRRAARMAFRRRLVDTAGVVASNETPIDASLLVQAIMPGLSKKVIQAFKKLRDEWETPDGWPIADSLSMFRHARELALGFYYVWDPRPPTYWLEARKQWASFVRKTIRYSKKLDSELQVRRVYGDTKECKQWLQVRDAFTPNTIPRWIDYEIVDTCAKWAEKHAGIIWTEHQCFGKKLASISGLCYYGKKGKTTNGKAIEDAVASRPLIASVQSNGTGRNLQKWSRNLITSMPANGMQTEQLFGRTHRDGQKADEVSFEIIISCAEHIGAFWQAHRDSQYTFDTTGAPQKLLLADILIPNADQMVAYKGPQWEKELN